MKLLPPIGVTFGRLTVLGPSSDSRRHWHCRCSCGNECAPSAYNVRGGRTLSCGCWRRERSRLNAPEVRIPIAPGDVFGRLTVVGRAATPQYWICRCSCGATTTTYKYSLTSGNTRSCGCYNRDVGRSRSTHGRSKTPEYVIWGRMIQRCRNPANHDFPLYGGRGIAVSSRWLNFQAFFADVGARPTRKHSLHRIDNDRGYEPGNVVWATATVQGRNKRNNRHLTLHGATRTFAEWVERFGISRAALNHRLRRGWSVERALTTPYI